MFTPAMILKIWKRVNDRFGLAGDDPKAKDKEKKVSPKAKQAEKEDKRVEKGLTGLRVIGKGDLSEPTTGKKFLKSRDKTAKSMKKYAKLLKSNDLKESVQDLTKFRKAVKQLIVVVELLDARPYPDEAEGGEPDLNALEKVDTSALDKAMEDPKFGEYSDAELDQDETETEAGVTAPTAKEGGPGSIPPGETARDDRGLKIKQRLEKLVPAGRDALQAGAPNRAALQQASQLASNAYINGDFAQAEAQADILEAELKKATGAAQTPARADPAAEWKKKLAEWTPAIKAAMMAKGPNAAAIAKLLAQATALSKPGGDIAQALEKLTECHGLATAGTASAKPAEDLAAVFKAKVQAFRPSFDKALAQSRANNPELVEELDGYFAQMFDEAKAKKFETALQTLQILEKLVATATPPSDPAAEYKKKLAEWTPAIKSAMTAKGPNAAAIAKLLAQATALSKPGGDIALALEKLTECNALAKSPAAAKTPDPAAIKAALAGWDGARGTAIAQLQQLGAAIKGFNHPKSTEAIILVKAIQANLTAKPETLQSVVELERYLETDSIIDEAEARNGFGITVALRKPLLEALGKLKPLLSA